MLSGEFDYFTNSDLDLNSTKMILHGCHTLIMIKFSVLPVFPV